MRDRHTPESEFLQSKNAWTELCQFLLTPAAPQVLHGIALKD